MTYFLEFLIFFLSISATGSSSLSKNNTEAQQLENFLFIGASNPQEFSSRISDKIDGVQVVYPWKTLETKKDTYNFQVIERDLTYINGRNKKLWIQLQDRFFSPKDRSIPSYLQEEDVYKGGLALQGDNRSYAEVNRLMMLPK